MKPYISVIIAAYNEEKLLPRCIESLQKQTYPKENYEIIVVDNNSKDSTGEVAKKLKTHALFYDKIQACGASRNFGAQHAKGSILAFTDADAVLPPDWLEKIDKHFKNPKLISLGGKILPDKNSVGVDLLFAFYDVFYVVNNVFHKPILWGFNMAIRKDAYDAVGGIDEKLFSSDDWDLALRLKKRFGVKGMRYVEDVRAYTSIRKYEGTQTFLRYAWDGVYNYVNLILLGRRKPNPVFNVR